MVYVWAAAFVLFLIAEAATVGLVSIWFALGSLAALLAAALEAPLWFQFILFICASGLILLGLRPFAQKFINTRKLPTNADRVIGMICPVTEAIDNILATGAVVVDGKTWTARSFDGSNLPVGTLVRPMSIQGVKLIVEPVSGPASEPEQNPDPMDFQL